MATDTLTSERRRAIAQRISVLLLLLGSIVVVGYLLFVPGRASDHALTPLGQRLSFVLTRPVVVTLLVFAIVWLTYKTLFIDRGSLFGRCAAAACGMGGALCYPEATREIGVVFVLGGVFGGLLALVLEVRRDAGLLTRPVRSPLKR